MGSRATARVGGWPIGRDRGGPSVVERVHEDAADARGRQTGISREPHGADGPQRIALEQADRRSDGGWVDLEGVRWIHRAAEAQRRVSARVGALLELCGVAVRDPLG